MKKIAFVIITSILFGACGDNNSPTSLPDSTQFTTDMKILTPDKCEYVSWLLNSKSLPGEIDTSYDLDINKDGIQAKVSMMFTFGVVPQDVSVAILYNGNLLPTSLEPNGRYEADTTIQKDEHHFPQIIMFQAYTYGWCPIPAIISTVKW
jgi:hypothetical protein